MLSCTAASHAAVIHRTTSCTALSHSHVWHSSSPQRTGLPSKVPPSSALHNSDPRSCELRSCALYSSDSHSSDPHSCPRASPSTSTQRSRWGRPGATGRALLVQELSHFRAHPTQSGAFACVKFFIFCPFFFFKAVFQNKQKKLYLQVHKESGMDP